MEAIGKVIEINGKYATVESQRNSACSSCHNCEAKGACHAELIFGEQNQTVVSVADNTIGAKIGDTVEIEASTSKTLFVAFMIFVFPVAIAVLMYFLLSQFISNTTVLAVSLVASFVVAFIVLIKIMNVYVTKKVSLKIVRITQGERI